MKALVVGESREGAPLEATYEVAAFAGVMGAETAMFLVGDEAQVPQWDGKLYLADAAAYGDYNPDAHKALLLEAVGRENPDYVIFSHSYYGWDLAPRIAFALEAAQVSEAVGYDNGVFIVPACNAKLRRRVRPKTKVTVVTIQAGAFTPPGEPQGAPSIERIDAPAPSRYTFAGYEMAEKTGADLSKAEIIIGTGRGLGKPENIPIVAGLAEALGAELGATRPVVDAGWLDHDRQVGTSGQIVSPKLYIACGISGAIQHLAGMKKSGFIVAVNTDKDAPIGEAADVFVVADLKQFVPALTEKIRKIKT